MPRNERGVVLVVGLMILVALTLLGVTAAVTTMADMKVGVNYRRSTEAFYLAEAGAEWGREQLRALNAASLDKGSFSNELAATLGLNGVLNGNVTGSDDVLLVPKTTLGNGSYIVYLTNDAIEDSLNATDKNRRATLISVATIPNGTKDSSLAIIETTVAMYEPFPLPATITLLGTGATYSGNASNAKDLHGDDQCGSDAPRPVVDVSDPADLANLRGAIHTSKPAQYITKETVGGPNVNGNNHPEDISQAIPTSQLTDPSNPFGINLLDPVALNGLVTSLKAPPNTVCSSCSGVNVGTTTPYSPKVVVATGDFTLTGNGAGILVVQGKLTLHGDFNYTGLILVIGAGNILRDGGGTGVIQGGIVVANTRGPDNILNTADDNIALGPPTFNTNGGGDSSLNYCSSALYDAYSQLPLRVVSWRPHYK